MSLCRIIGNFETKIQSQHTRTTICSDIFAKNRSLIQHSSKLNDELLV